MAEAPGIRSEAWIASQHLANTIIKVNSNNNTNVGGILVPSRESIEDKPADGGGLWEPFPKPFCVLLTTNVEDTWLALAT